ncbi:phosphate acetyltransferase [Tessaracoccus sp. OH4464_COT-324]|uniref:phosphate acetyltransferase n=1 Tax=Tessaracoccus sp. OH4464_COT-324 TaxID=2491059 RepID=UPI000F64162D|nr:phosphate acetyltransferase [Tessaracoccus sp. OH4464_COT-324]RRD46101.1 phosphate acetyltransferase [Tessaracoccus sp. OH4464_COT-324]
MTKSVYISAAERQVSKSAIALGVLELFASKVKNVGVFRPLVHSLEHDVVAEALLSHGNGKQSLESALGVTYEQYAQDPAAAIDTLVAKYAELSARNDAMVIVGSDYTDVESAQELGHNATFAANLNAPVILVTKAAGLSPDEVARATEAAVEAFESRHNTVISIIGTNADPAGREEVAERLRAIRDVPVAVVPYSAMLNAPTVAQQFAAAEAKFWRGNESLLSGEALDTIVGAMTLPNLLPHLQREATVILPADRLELVPGLIMAHRSPEYGPLSSLILTGGFEIPQSIHKLFASANIDLPIAITSKDTFSTAAKLKEVHSFSTSSSRKIETARNLFASYVDREQLLAAIDLPRTELRTPTMFEHQLTQMARAHRRRIVLPESTDDRILEAAAIVLARGVAEIILLGDAGQITRRASALGLNLSAAEVVNPQDPELLEKFATEYARLRAHKGVSIETAREKLADLSYFGTMMVHMGMADGMVSGAVNTTANTIRPSLEFIKTRPGVSVVSGAFLMCMSDRVLVYADCAVNPDPTPDQLADIAISSAQTAATFGIEPRVAMLSYSTGTSGSGTDVDKVREATELVRERAPHVKVDGPMQFDAAVDHVVAAKKMPGSEVAGRATVFVFPDLNTGNNTYKAVQRHSGAVAVGPLLQGLNKAVNDLSRGALVDDIVSTISLTAIQSQNL